MLRGWLLQEDRIMVADILGKTPIEWFPSFALFPFLCG
jgi:hypothetical protein